MLTVIKSSIPLPVCHYTPVFLPKGRTTYELYLFAARRVHPLWGGNLARDITGRLQIPSRGNANTVTERVKDTVPHEGTRWLGDSEAGGGTMFGKRSWEVAEFA